MLPDGRNNYACTLILSFLANEFRQNSSVVVVQMTYRLVQQQKTKRLTQTTYHRNTLLLPPRQLLTRSVQLVRQP